MNVDNVRDSDEYAWELISFLALAAEEQKKLIGPTRQWFCEEDDAVNPGANYLLGVMHAFLALKNVIFDSAELGEDSVLFELDALLRLMLAESNDDFVTMEGLSSHPVWRLVRRLAVLMLHEAGLELNPPMQPFWFPNLLEVEGYPLRRVSR